MKFGLPPEVIIDAEKNGPSRKGRWFAWYPVLTEDVGLVWLRSVWFEHYEWGCSSDSYSRWNKYYSVNYDNSAATGM